MKKILKLYGGTLVLTFTKEEQEAYSLKAGDFIDLTKAKVIRTDKKFIQPKSRNIKRHGNKSTGIKKRKKK